MPRCLRLKKSFCRMATLLLLGYFLVATFLSYNIITSSIVKDPNEVSLLDGGRGRRRPSNRFPKFGTPEFVQQCRWTLDPTRSDDDCTYFVRPKPKSTEGISDWISTITTGYLLAKQAGCRLLLEYGPGVNVQDVLSPHHKSLESEKVDNWLVPVDFDCKKENRCFGVAYPGGSAKSREYYGKDLALVPAYRFAYQTKTRFHLYSIDYRNLQSNLPGFRIETGMACSLESLFHLSDSASQLEPRLFTSILPKLQNEEALVLALYIRTGETDVKANEEDTTGYREGARQILNCTLSIEERQLSGLLTESAADSISKVVWMVVTDSPDVKHWIHDSYDGEDVNARVPVAQQKWPSRVIPRQVLFTESHGRHTRTKGNPSNVDFAEALIDWYLIGESDLVIAQHEAFSFGATAALRTARPFYGSATCSKMVLVHSSSTE